MLICTLFIIKLLFIELLINRCTMNGVGGFRHKFLCLIYLLRLTQL